MPQEYGSNCYTAKVLDHSSGHAFLSPGGDVYYSPNCSRRVDVPAPDDRYPFYLKEAKFEKFLSPRWWQKPYHYFSFVPIRPSFDGIVFETLRDYVIDIEPVGDGEFGLSSRKMRHWLELEDSLIVLAHLLNKWFFTSVRPGLTPIPASLLGFKKKFSTFRSACLRIAASRDWFIMWMSLISSKITDIETYYNVDWFCFLVGKGCPQDWLSAVQSSLCDFSYRCPRVGTFLNIKNLEPDQPSVEWFYTWNIPVWYRLPGYGHLQPPAHILQCATTFLTKFPSRLRVSAPPRAPSPSRAPSTPPPPKYAGREYMDAQRAYIATKPWQAFFAAREVNRQEILAKETPSQRQIRKNRELKPPEGKADLFLWEWSLGDRIELVRTRVVSKDERKDILSRYSSKRCKYDSVFNTWEVCAYFGTDDDNDDDDDDSGGDKMDVDASPNPDRDVNTVKAFVEERIDCFNKNQFALAIAPSSVAPSSDQVPEGPEDDLTQGANDIDVLKYLSRYYGFVPPLPIPDTDLVSISLHDWDESLKSVGLQSGIHLRLPGLTGPIVDFIRRLQGDGPQKHEWDILPGNRQPLNPKDILKCFYKLDTGHFLVNGNFVADRHSIDWQIAVDTSANALYILRYLLQSSDYPSSAALARHLAEEGIPFYTLQKLDPFPSSFPLDAIKIIIPRRGTGYTFTQADFHSYVAERKRILATPRARAAILRGGIVGRLAKEHLDIDSVTLGPSSSVTSHRLGYSIEFADVTFWDDGLSDDELAVICGLYCCYTGNRDQTAWLSWWPLPEYWENKSNSYNWNRWTELDEIWYQNHLSGIQNGVSGHLPLSHTQWRNKLRASSSWRKVTKAIENRSDTQF